MAKKITTESGRVYVIDGSFWRRLPKTPGEYKMGWEKVWSLKHGTVLQHPSMAPEGTWSDGQPVIGEFMHIGCRDFGWTSTEVVSIEEILSEMSD